MIKFKHDEICCFSRPDPVFSLATHDLGMAMDIGITDLVSRGQSRANEPLLTTIANYAPADPTSNPLNRWSNTNASALLALLSREADNNQQAALGNFFSLYAMTQSGTNGSRDALRAQIRTTPQDQADTVLNALFGGGTQATGLISKVHIGGTAALGQNPYLNINNALAKLGVTSTPVDFHHNHFHVYLRPPVIRGLPNMLEASEQLPHATVSGSAILVPQAVETLAKNTAPLSPAIVKKVNQSVPICIGVNTSGSTAAAQKQDSWETIPIDPLMYVANSLTALGIRPSAAMSVQLLKGPLHGTATLKTGLTGSHAILGATKFPNEGIRFESNANYTYESKPGFIGGDQIIFLVTLNNTQFRVKVNIVVKPGGFDNLREFDCESFEVTKVSAATSSAEYAFDALSNEDALSLDLAQWQRSAQLSALIANAQQSLEENRVRSCKSACMPLPYQIWQDP